MLIVTTLLLMLCALLAVWIHLHGGRLLKAPIALWVTMGLLALTTVFGFIADSVGMMRGDLDTVRTLLVFQGILFFFGLNGLIAFVLFETAFRRPPPSAR